MEEGTHAGASSGPPEPPEEQELRDADAALYRDAETIEQALRFIQHAMRHGVEADKRIMPLTPPQIQVLALLTRSAQGAGPTLKELSESLGLAHSTVSGIVDRLERHGLVRRVTNPHDRRASNIEITARVTRYLQQSLPSRRLHPLLTALQHASGEERNVVIEGLVTLQGLFTRVDKPSEE